MPQSPAAAIVWFQTAKKKNTKQSNQKTNMNKTAFWGVEFIVCMTFATCTTYIAAALLDTRKAVKQLLVFTVTPFKIDQNKNQNRSIDKVQNLGNERRYIYKDPRQDSGQRNISYKRYPKKCFTQRSRVALLDALCHPSPSPRKTRTLILSHTRTFWQIFAESFCLA